MKQLPQLTIEQHNEHMRCGEAMLPVDVVENTLIHELPFGAWFRKNGVMYMRVCTFHHDAVRLDGHMVMFDYGDKCEPINVIITESN